MNSSQEKWVRLDKTVAFFITYFTSWVDEDGVLHFTDDIYGHDKKLAAHLFKYIKRNIQHEKRIF